MNDMTRVCVIDDNPLVRDALALGLDDDGFDVFVAPDGEMGLAIIERVHPDVVLTDLQMPGIEGLVLIPMLRQKYPRMPIVAMSGETVPEDIGGADIFLRKPFNVPAARDAIDRARTLRQR